MFPKFSEGKETCPHAGCLEDKDYPTTALLLAIQGEPLNSSIWRKVELEQLDSEEQEEQMEGGMTYSFNSTLELYSRLKNSFNFFIYML